eukprot:CAMPEP_0113685474 /NCGR_PEP_ID=MMETSP0038_2-20120614/14690_1 /TAXON_ID=2898 /ORGANISM="Cryptomonas paramecium" /LENGTH=40 /DNA_ID=CAMNT_0000605561 /DNA_START=157 /DNA_END=275 /DNA_ORIENTATION=+ /assembly_acc=CAM_ASM_000170
MYELPSKSLKVVVPKPMLSAMRLPFALPPDPSSQHPPHDL